MARLVGYGMLSSNGNLSGNLVKAQCDICKRKYGSLEEARLCESNHLIRKDLEFDFDKYLKERCDGKKRT